MGQNVPCLIYGCPVPTNLVLWDDYNPGQGVVEAFEHEFGWPSGLTTTPECDTNFLGYEVGILGGYAQHGAPLSYLMHDLLESEVWSKWSHFAAWVAQNYQVVLPEPDTYLAMTEIG